MHLLQEEAEPPQANRLADLECGLVTVGHAFQRWALRCMAACGVKEMTITDVLVLHHVNHRARGKKLADIAFILNIEDVHVVSYSLKKLQQLGLVQAERHGKEVLYSANDQGRELCARYYAIREQVLVAGLETGGVQDPDLARAAHFLRMLSGLYDQAARSAATM